MHKHSLFKSPMLAILLALALIVAPIPLAGTNSVAKAQSSQTEGMVCTSGPNFTLTSHDGYIGTPDGNVVYMWGLSSGSDSSRRERMPSVASAMPFSVSSACSPLRRTLQV